MTFIWLYGQADYGNLTGWQERLLTIFLIVAFGLFLYMCYTVIRDKIRGDL